MLAPTLMTLSLQEISDRLEIQDLVYEYAALIDQKRFDDLRRVFTEDATIDYSAVGGPVGNPEQIIAFLNQVMVMFSNHQHLNANLQISVDGDTATGRVMCFNPQEMSMPDGKTHIFMVGLWYVDEYRRTADGWRISKRVEEKSYLFNAPS
jgi:ketosteroid isomerase-like protein